MPTFSRLFVGHPTPLSLCCSLCDWILSWLRLLLSIFLHTNNKEWIISSLKVLCGMECHPAILQGLPEDGRKAVSLPYAPKFEGKGCNHGCNQGRGNSLVSGYSGEVTEDRRWGRPLSCPHQSRWATQKGPQKRPFSGGTGGQRKKGQKVCRGIR